MTAAIATTGSASRLKGENDNKSAIGTKVELYAGALQQKWEIAGASGYLGQGPTPIVAGLGAERQARRNPPALAHRRAAG